MYYLGIDTSNYTTSLALYNSEDNSVIQSKKLLPVKQGELGLRQSDALFHHTKQLPELFKELFKDFTGEIKAVGVSVKPRNAEGSYMPCFLAGESVATAISSANDIPLHKTSHQAGHILAALYSADRLELIKSPFIAFHVSGGTTDCLYVEPDDNEIIKITEIGTSLDLKAGQAVDRVGLMMNLSFPCGKELEKLALMSDKDYKIKTVLKDSNCCLSGIENKCRKMLDDGEKKSDVAKFCLDSICSAVSAMTEYALAEYGNLPIIYAGGVMSDKIIQNKLSEKFNAFFAEPEYSCDNALGIALFARITEERYG
ncbi:MAG: peptidase M22 [Oscillospiraceae bacterium]|nr:peptidase M22 [Oscillospiraceae bacterium]